MELAHAHNALPEVAEPDVQEVRGANLVQARQPLFSRRSGRRAIFAPQVLSVALDALMAGSVQDDAPDHDPSPNGAYSDFGPGLVHFRPQSNSLFSGSARGSFFAPLPEKSEPDLQPKNEDDAPVDAQPHTPIDGTRDLAPGEKRVDRNALRDLIARAEAGAKGYDAVNYGARIKPPKPPSSMTLGEIYDWIAATPGQPHAIGRYQFIPKTLKRLARAREVGSDVRFGAQVQDELADLLLLEAGLMSYEAGTLSRRGFMHNLAKIWAGLPTATGKSHYEGYAGNKATMTWAVFDRGVLASLRAPGAEAAPKQVQIPTRLVRKARALPQRANF